MEKSCFPIFYGNNEIDHPAASQFRGDPGVVVVMHRIPLPSLSVVSAGTGMISLDSIHGFWCLTAELEVFDRTINIHVSVCTFQLLTPQHGLNKLG